MGSIHAQHFSSLEGCTSSFKFTNAMMVASSAFPIKTMILGVHQFAFLPPQYILTLHLQQPKNRNKTGFELSDLRRRHEDIQGFRESFEEYQPDDENLPKAESGRVGRHSLSFSVCFSTLRGSHLASSRRRTLYNHLHDEKNAIFGPIEVGSVVQTNFQKLTLCQIYSGQNF